MADGEAKVCHQCFGDTFLKREIRRKGSRGECCYCGKTLVTLSLEEITDLFESAIETHYEKTPSGPSEMEQAMRIDSWYPNGTPIVDLIQEIGETSTEIAGDIQSVLEDRHSTREDYEMGNATEFDSESHYEERATPRSGLDEEWTDFEHNLRTKSRYMSVKQTGQTDLLAFSGKIEGKAQWSRGVFISYSGFTPEGLEAFGRGKSTRIVCMDGLDLHCVLTHRLSLAEVIASKVRRAGETNEAYVSIRELFPSKAF